MKYNIIDADSHVNSPPDLYQSRVPKAYRDRAPKLVAMDGHDAWVVDGPKAKATHDFGGRSGQAA